MHDSRTRACGLTMHFTCRARWLAVALLPLVFGCGPEEQVLKDRAVVSGVVTFAGKPLPAGTITFMSKESHLASPASIDKGRYSTNRAPIGSNLVSIETESLQYGYAAGYVPIPAKYADTATSGLTAEIKSGDNANVDFNLE